MVNVVDRMHCTVPHVFQSTAAGLLAPTATVKHLLTKEILTKPIACVLIMNRMCS